MVAVTDTNYALTPDQHSRELRRAVIAATVSCDPNSNCDGYSQGVSNGIHVERATAQLRGNPRDSG